MDNVPVTDLISILEEVPPETHIPLIVYLYKSIIFD